MVQYFIWKSRRQMFPQLWPNAKKRCNEQLYKWWIKIIDCLKFVVWKSACLPPCLWRKVSATLCSANGSQVIWIIWAFLCSFVHVSYSPWNSCSQKFKDVPVVKAVGFQKLWQQDKRPLIIFQQQIQFNSHHRGL